MKCNARRIRLCWFAGVLFIASSGTSEAQRYKVRSSVNRGKAPAKRPEAPADKTDGKANENTDVTIEIIAGTAEVGLNVQSWQSLFERLDFPIRVRSGLADDEPSTEEKTIGRLRQVVVVGKLDRNGNLVFADRTFSPNDQSKLIAWLRELKTYGAQGAPAGKPLWGLNQSQFDQLFKALSQKTENEVEGKTLEPALAALQVPRDFVVRMSAASEKWLGGQFAAVPAVRQQLKGFSKGTALAILLTDYGLGFHPVRTPDGSIELVVEPLADVKELWPVGWDIKLSRQQTAPKLFSLASVGFDDVKFHDVIHAIAVTADVPIHIDHLRIESAGIKLDKVKVSYPSRQTSYSQVLRAITNPHRMTQKLRIDELGQPFVWITTLVPGESEK